MLSLSRLNDYVNDTLGDLHPEQLFVLKTNLGLRSNQELTQEDITKGIERLQVELLGPAERPHASEELKEILSVVKLPPAFRECELLLGELAEKFIRFAEIEKFISKCDKKNQIIDIDPNLISDIEGFEKYIKEKSSDFERFISLKLAELAVESFTHIDSFRALAASISRKEVSGYKLYLGSRLLVDFNCKQTVAAQVVEETSRQIEVLDRLIFTSTEVRENRSLNASLKFTLSRPLELVDATEIRMTSGLKGGSLRGHALREINNTGNHKVRDLFSSYISVCSICLDRLSRQEREIANLRLLDSRPDTVVSLMIDMVANILSSKIKRKLKREEFKQIQRQLQQSIELDPNWGSFIKAACAIKLVTRSDDLASVVYKPNLMIASDASRSPRQHIIFTFNCRKEHTLQRRNNNLIIPSVEDKLIELLDELALVDSHTADRYRRVVSVKSIDLLREAFPKILNIDRPALVRYGYDRNLLSSPISQFSVLWSACSEMYKTAWGRKAFNAWLQAFSKEYSSQGGMSISDMSGLFSCYEYSNFVQKAPIENGSLVISGKEVSEIIKNSSGNVEISKCGLLVMLCLLDANKREILINLIYSNAIIIDISNYAVIRYLERKQFNELRDDIFNYKRRNKQTGPIRLSQLVRASNINS